VTVAAARVVPAASAVAPVAFVRPAAPQVARQTPAGPPAPASGTPPREGLVREVVALVGTVVQTLLAV
jgi:hypothetical protein